VKKEGEGRAETGKRNKGRGLGYKAKNSEEGRRRKGWNKEMGKK